MDCRDYQSKFSAYLDGELTAKERQYLQFHLKECLPCYRNWSFLQKSHEVLRRLPELEPTPHLSTIVMARLKDRNFRQRSRFSAGFRRWAPLAVGAAALLLISIGLWQIIPSTLTWQSFIPGAQKEIVTQDSSGRQPETNFTVKKRSPGLQPPVMVLKVKDFSRADQQLESMLRSLSRPMTTEREPIRPPHSSSARLIDIQVQGENFPLLIRELHKIGHLDKSQLESHELAASKQPKSISIRIVVVSEKK
jgi:negative regulator of sigma E activity